MKRVQTSPSTKFLRHRAATIEVIECLSALGSDARLLCFGSSWGAEVAPFALALPEATIVAAEIDSTALAKCRHIYSDFENVHVVNSDWPILAEFGKFSAINANAVFCKFPAAANTFDLGKVFPFGEFEEMIGRLNELLCEDGLLTLHNSNYLLEDSEVARDFLPLFLPPTFLSPPDNFVGYFSKDGQKLVHVSSHNEAPTVELSRELEFDLPSVRKWVAKQLNQGVFIKGPSHLNRVRCLSSAAVFDSNSRELSAGLAFDLTKLVGKEDASDSRMFKVPLRRHLSLMEQGSKSNSVGFISTLWWEEQIMSHPILL